MSTTRPEREGIQGTTCEEQGVTFPESAWETAERFLMRPDYTIGYCMPPKAYQWKPGQSGNPKGRPRGSKNMATRLRERYGL